MAKDKIDMIDWARYREMKPSERAEVNTSTTFAENRETPEKLEDHVNVFGLGTDKKSETKNK